MYSRHKLYIYILYIYIYSQQFWLIVIECDDISRVVMETKCWLPAWWALWLPWWPPTGCSNALMYLLIFAMNSCYCFIVVLLEIKLTTTTTTKCRLNYCVIIVIYVRLRQKKNLILKQTACRRIIGNRMLPLEAICVCGDWGHILGFQETMNRSCRLCAHQQESYSNGRHIMTITNRWLSARLQ